MGDLVKVILHVGTTSSPSTSEARKIWVSGELLDKVAPQLLGWIIQDHTLLIQGAAVRAVHRRRRIRHRKTGRFSVLAGMELIDARKGVDGVTSGTWMLMQFLVLVAEIEGLLARDRRGGDERFYIQFTVTNEMGNQEALNLSDRL